MDSPALELEQRRALVRLFLDQVPPAVAGHLIVAGALAALGWQRTGTLHPLVWYVVLAAVLGLRLVLARRQRTDAVETESTGLRQIERMQTLLAGLTGLAWGSFVWAAHPDGDFPLDALTFAIVMGNNGIAISSLAAIPAAFPALAWGALLPIAIKGFSVGDDINITAAAAMLFGGAIMTAFNRNASRAIAETIRLRDEKSQLVEQLRQEKEAAEEAYRVKSLFLAGVSHDLRHPLHALRLYLGYLKGLPADKPAEAGIAPAMPGMESALAGMSDLLARLLELSRLEAGEYQAQRAALPLRSILDASAARFASEAAARGLRLRVVDTGRRVIGDPVLLQSVVDNLLSNAVRYTASGGILVGLRREDDGLRLEVRDSGGGIPTPHREQIFEAYRRFDDTGRAQDGGYGLGLALVCRQCAAMGYRVALRATSTRGSIFAVHIPAACLVGTAVPPAPTFH